MSAAAGPAWFKVYAVYMVIGFVALMLSYFGTKERIIPTAEETDKVKYSDLVNELKRNRPLQILGLFFLIGFTFMFFGNTVWPFYLKYNIGHSEDCLRRFIRLYPWDFRSRATLSMGMAI